MFVRRKFNTNFINFLNEAKINIYDKGVSINILDLFSFEQIRPSTGNICSLLRTYIRFNCDNNEISFVPDMLMLKYFGERLPKYFNDRVSTRRLKELIEQETTIDNSIEPVSESCSQLTAILQCLFSYPKNKSKYRDIFKFILTIKIKTYEKEFCNLLIDHPSINKLCFSIILNDNNKVQEHIERYNPCSNHFRAYRLIKPIKQEIKKCVLNKIISLLLLYKKVLQETGCNDDIIQYVIRLL